ncbi:MAG: hypothetical protein ACRDP4_08790 [Nocardioidaceae bacterium]
MSEIAEHARVSITLADYARIDNGKADILGAGWQVIGIGQQGTTNPLAVVVGIATPPSHYGQEYAMELTLIDDETGEVAVPAASGSGSLRIGQTVVADAPTFPNQYVPPKTIWARHQLVANFSSGISLVAGKTYTWQVRIDGDNDHTWGVTFHVAGPPPGPVVG